MQHAEWGTHMGADGLSVPGPDQAVRAAQQLRGQPPQALPAHQHDGQRPGSHRCVHCQLHPRRGCLSCGAKICGACIQTTDALRTARICIHRSATLARLDPTDLERKCSSYLGHVPNANISIVYGCCELLC